MVFMAFFVFNEREHKKLIQSGFFFREGVRGFVSSSLMRQRKKRPGQNGGGIALSLMDVYESCCYCNMNCYILQLYLELISSPILTSSFPFRMTVLKRRKKKINEMNIQFFAMIL